MQSHLITVRAGLERAVFASPVVCRLVTVQREAREDRRTRRKGKKKMCVGGSKMWLESRAKVKLRLYPSAPAVVGHTIIYIFVRI